MSEEPVVTIHAPTDYSTLKVRIGGKECEILITTITLNRTTNILVVTASVDCADMQNNLGWSDDCFNHGIALTIVQAAVIAHYQTEWRFVNSQTVVDTSGYSNYLVTFTFTC